MRRGFIQLAPLRKNEPPDYPCLDMNPDKVSQITHVWVPHTSEPGSRPVAWECLNEIKLKQNVGCRNPLAGRHRYRFRHVSIGQKLKLLFLVFIGKQCRATKFAGRVGSREAFFPPTNAVKCRGLEHSFAKIFCSRK